MVRISLVISILSYAIVLCGVIPLFPWLTVTGQVTLAACLSASLLQDRFGPWRLKNWMLNASIIPLFLYYASQVSRSNVVEPVANLLVIMLAIRLLSEKSGRHYLQIQVLSLFCLSSSTLFDLSPMFLIYLCLMLFMVAVSLVLLTFHDCDSRMQLSRYDMRRVVCSGLIMPLASLPLLLFFFTLLPRTQLPLWNFLNVAGTAETAFSDKVEPGTHSATGESMVVAFRAEMQRLPQRQLYWRGTVFNRVDGNRWLRDGNVPPERIIYGSKRITQTIFQEPGLSKFLMALDAPATLFTRRVVRSPDGTYQQFYSNGKRLSYEVTSFYSGILPVESGINRDYYLKLPRTVSPRIRQLAAAIRSRSNSDMASLEALETQFRKNGYPYSVHGLPTGNDALEQFLFEKKPGNCEFFASAFAIILRAAGVPARLVGGYLGGEYNDLGGYYQITEKMAHVWVEAYVEGKGWIRIDPSSFAANADAVWGSTAGRGGWARVLMALDSIDHVWNRSVVAYDLESQLEIARNAGRRLQALKTVRMPELSFGLPMLTLAGVAVLFVWFRRKTLFRSREERVLAAFLGRVGRDCAVEVKPGQQGLYDIALSSGSKRAGEFVDIYAGAVYRDRRLSAEEYSKLKKMLKAGFRD